MQTTRNGFKQFCRAVDIAGGVSSTCGVRRQGAWLSLSRRGVHLSRCTSLPNKTVADAQPNRHQDIYDDAYRRSIKRPEDFWAAAAEQLTWHKKWDKVLDDSNSPMTKWFENMSNGTNSVIVEQMQKKSDDVINPNDFKNIYGNYFNIF